MALIMREVQMTEEEYIASEWLADRCHEYIDGWLIDTPEESIYNNSMTINIVLALRECLKPMGFHTYIKDVKVKIPNENKYYYPDGFATREDSTGYILHHPEIIVEVVCDETREYDSVDKFSNYQKFESLKYYLLAEPEFLLITLYSKNKDGQWEMKSYTDYNDSINLPLFDCSITLKEIYSQHYPLLL